MFVKAGDLMDVPVRCIICSRGSSDGINILGSFICSECEKVIVNSDVDCVDYNEYKDLIKKNIYGDMILK